MSGRKVIPLRPRGARRPVRTRALAEAATLARGLLFLLSLIVLGTFLVAAALVVGVVGSPLVALAVGWLVWRHARHPRGGAPRRLRVAGG